MSLRTPLPLVVFLAPRLELLHQSECSAMQQRTPVRHVWVTGHVSQNAGLSSEITIVSVAPSGLVRCCITTTASAVGCILLRRFAAGRTVAAGRIGWVWDLET